MIYLRYLQGVSREIDPLQVDVSMATGLDRYKEILVECLRVPDGLTEADIPALAEVIVESARVESASKSSRK